MKKLFLFIRPAVILLILSLLTRSVPLYAQEPDMEQILKNAPPELREILKNLPKASMEQMMQDNKPKGKLTFEVVPSGSAMGVQASGAPIALPPLSEAMKGGAIYAYKVDYCGNTPVTKYMYVLKIDSNDKRNLFTTNQVDKTATLTLAGIMDRWEFNCNTKSFSKVETGLGGMQVHFSTSVHIRPRMFQVMAGSKDVRGEYLKKVKEAHLFMLSNLSKYYKDVGEYLKKPKISIINIPDHGPVGGIPPAPAGMTSDEEDAVTTGKAIGTALNVIQTMAGIKSPDDIKSALFDYAKGKAVERFDQFIESLGVAEVTAAYNQFKEITSAASDPGGYLMDKAIQGMIQQIAAVNKQYAEKGDPLSNQIQEVAKKQMNHKDRPYSYADADYMASMLNNAYEGEIKRLEAEAQMESQLPPTAASGKIWGPGLWENLQVYAIHPGEPVAFSDAPGENKSSFDPNVLAALKKAGYPVPDKIPDTKVKQGGFSFDASKPYFHGKLSGTDMLTLPQGIKYPKMMVHFSVSSPEEPYQFAWKGLTIFDPPFVNDDNNEKEKCTFYVSTTGLNTNPGTAEAPFKTIQFALDKAKICRDGKKPVDIMIKPGIYHQSATINWNDGPEVYPIRVSAITPGTVSFTSSETTTAQWQSAASGWQASMPLHPQQPTWTATNDIVNNPPPVLTVNGQRMVYIPLAKNLPSPGTYNISGNKANVRPQNGVTALNSAVVEVGVRPFAFKISGAKNISISNIRFLNYPQTMGNPEPGIIKQNGAQVNVSDCQFQ